MVLKESGTPVTHRSQNWQNQYCQASSITINHALQFRQTHAYFVNDCHPLCFPGRGHANPRTIKVTVLKQPWVDPLNRNIGSIYNQASVGFSERDRRGLKIVQVKRKQDLVGAKGSIE